MSETTDLTAAAVPRRRGVLSALWLHAGLLVLVVSVFVALGQPGVAFFSDEGAAVLQAQILRDSGKWQYQPPPGSAGQDFALSPFVRGDRGPQGVSPYAKHPLYPVLLSVVGPRSSAALLALSIGGTVAAAVGAVLLARRTAACSPPVELAVLWLVGVGTPLLFDSALVLAHTIAAGLVVFGVLAIIRARAVNGAGSGLFAGTGAILLATAAMVRTEVLFVGPALALALLAVDRRRARKTVVLAVCAAGSSVVAWGADRWWSGVIVGPTVGEGVRAESSGWLVDRALGSGTTLLRTTSQTLGIVDVSLWIGLTLVVVGALTWRRSARPDLLVFGLIVVVGAWFARLWIDPPALVPGLLVAFPVGLAASVVAIPPPKEARTTRVVWITIGLTAAGILLTQYGIGGGVEWGGRYFAVLIPLWVAVAIPSAIVSLAPMASGAQKAIVGLVVSVTVLAAVNMVAVQRHVHGRTAELLSAISESAALLPDAAQIDGRVVVISENRLLPQIAYTAFDDYAWVVGRVADLPRGLAMIEVSGVAAVLAVTPDPARIAVVAETAGWTVASRWSGSAYDVLVLQPAP